MRALMMMGLTALPVMLLGCEKTEPSAADDTASTATPEDTGSEETTETGPGNTSPVVTSVLLFPTEVYTDDIIVSEVTVEDDDGDAVTLSYQWLADGVPIPGAVSELLDGSEFSKGQSITLQLTPNDGQIDGAPLTSEPVVILNTPPGEPAIALTPTSPIEGEDALVCELTLDAGDLDEDALTYDFAWTVDGSDRGADAVTDLRSSTVSATATLAGEVWTCTVTPDDGEATGPSAEASVTVTGLCDQTILVAMLPSWGGPWNYTSTNFSELDSGWPDYGCNEVVAVNVAPGFDLADLQATGATVLLLSNPAGGNVQYSSDEMDAVREFVEGGDGGVVATFLFRWTTVDNSAMADLVGVDPAALQADHQSSSGLVEVLDPKHPLTDELPETAFSLTGYPYTQLLDGALADALLPGATLVAADTSELDAIVVYEADWRGVWFTGLPEYSNSDPTRIQAIYNALNWASGY